MIAIQRATPPFILITLVVYIAYDLSVKKNFVYPIHDFECKLLLQFILLIKLNLQI